MRSAWTPLVVLVLGFAVVAWRVEAGDGKSVEDRLTALEKRVAQIEERLPRKTPEASRGGPGIRKTVESQIVDFKQAIEMYFLDNRSLPSSLSELMVPSKKTGEAYVDGPKLPSDPWGTDYSYSVLNASKREFSISSAGSDRIFGTDDDIVWTTTDGFK